ncbi:hypothetical protein K438DRAFT_1750454 [Mycena galopus ATCC 62051]|nr:hypothetical protein K438DRAFT_1750454 [Mycena galopus ATCC 62051]
MPTKSFSFGISRPGLVAVAAVTRNPFYTDWASTVLNAFGDKQQLHDTIQTGPHSCWRALAGQPPKATKAVESPVWIRTQPLGNPAILNASSSSTDTSARRAVNQVADSIPINTDGFFVSRVPQHDAVTPSARCAASTLLKISEATVASPQEDTAADVVACKTLHGT